VLTLKYIADNKEHVVSALAIKNFDASSIVDQVLTLDVERRSLKSQSDEAQAEMNALSREIGGLFKAGKVDEANAAKEKTAVLKESIKDSGAKLSEVEEELHRLLVQIPNVPHPSVTPGKGEEDNVEVSSGGEMPVLPEGAKAHWDLIKDMDLIDFELGTKITGAGFPVYKGKGARLQRALISYFLDQASEKGYIEVTPPIVVNEASGFGTGQLPDKEGQMYHCTEDNLYLIPTAEVPVTNIYRDVIVEEDKMPYKHVAYTPCFRREAGSWGAHVRGLNRLHQFDKVEIVQIEHPSRSYETLDAMVAHVESLVKNLGLPYRIMRLCGGDLSFTSALTFDFEVYSAAQERWLEVSSVSNFENYQANRLQCRYKGKDMKKPELVHTLNGSALALPRILAAILENYQTAEGIRIPEVLVPYTGFDFIEA